MQNTQENRIKAYWEDRKPKLNYKKQNNLVILRTKPKHLPKTDIDILRYTSSRPTYVPSVFTYIDKKLILNNRYYKSLERIKNYETGTKTQMDKRIIKQL